MRVKCDCGTRCTALDLARDPSGSATISASVGLGGANRADDVRTVQSLLNDVKIERGGPAPPLAVDGIAGPLTNGAIGSSSASRSCRSPTRVSIRTAPRFRRSTPNARTRPPDPDRKTREAARIANAVAAMGDAKLAVDRAIGWPGRRGGQLRHARQSLTTSSGTLRLRLQALQVRGLGRDHTLADLAFIKTTYLRMRGVLRGRTSITGTLIFGANMFDVDPNPGTSPPQAKAYVPGDDDGVVKSLTSTGPTPSTATRATASPI